jgi:hypothetical protein
MKSRDRLLSPARTELAPLTASAAVSFGDPSLRQAESATEERERERLTGETTRGMMAKVWRKKKM